MKAKDFIVKPTSIPDIERIPFGVFSLDALTGGGIPVGKISIFEGNKSSGKTTIALKVIGNFLRKYKNKQVLYLDLEESFDKDWASNFINKKDLDRILVINDMLYAEQIIDIVVELLKDDELDIGMILLDSVANLIPITDANKSAVDDTVGTLARVLNKFFRKVLPIKSMYKRQGRDLTLLLINQLRVKIGAAAFTSGYTKPGGAYQDFLAHLDIRFYNLGNETLEGIVVRTKHQFRIEKSKLKNAVQQMKGEFKLVLVDHTGHKVGETIDLPYIINSAKKYGALVRDGSKWYWLGMEFKSKKDIEDALVSDKKLYDKLYWDTVKLVSEKKLEELQ